MLVAYDGGVRSLALLGAFLLVGACLGCSRNESQEAPSARASAVPLDVDGVNALVPEALRARLVFEKRELVEKRGGKTVHVLAGPRDWTQPNEMFATLQPPESQRRSIHVELSLGTNCDGVCESKADWSETVEKVYASHLSGRVLKDEKRLDGRTIIAHILDNTMTVVVVAWWSAGDRQYSYCSAALDGDLREAAPAFERACELARDRAR